MTIYCYGKLERFWKLLIQLWDDGDWIPNRLTSSKVNRYSTILHFENQTSIATSFQQHLRLCLGQNFTKVKIRVRFSLFGYAGDVRKYHPQKAQQGKIVCGKFVHLLWKCLSRNLLFETRTHETSS